MRVLVYDRTCLVRRGWLTTPWAAGSVLYRALRRLGSQPAPINELQYWGHGKWGCALVGEDSLDAAAITSGRLAPLRAALAPNALVWFRTCETLGATAGIDFAERLADCTVASQGAAHDHVPRRHRARRVVR